MPPLEDLAEAATIVLSAGLQHNKELRKELEKLLRKDGIIRTWFPIQHGLCDTDIRLNTHLGAEGVITPGIIQDPEGAKIVMLFFKSAAGAILAI